MGPNPTLRQNEGPSDLQRTRTAGRHCSNVIERLSKLAVKSRYAAAMAVAVAWLMLAAHSARASTYVVYVALDDPVYQELDTLNGHGLLYDYLSEVKPIAQVEAARLVLEAERNLDDSEQDLG